jgi:3-isopropylmalate/(R)-2-methylmalate dehydratase small subunit
VSEPFVRHTGRLAALPRANVDTDQIVPKQFLKRVERTGFGPALFFDWRIRPDGSPNPDFELNQPAARGASLLLTGENFGCGSSREHAVWALRDYGFRAVIAPSFADIFASNCVKNGVLTVVLRPTEISSLKSRDVTGRFHLTVDLQKCEVSARDGFSARFELDPFRRVCLLEGLDEIGMTLRHEAEIAAYEKRRAS